MFQPLFSLAAVLLQPKAIATVPRWSATVELVQYPSILATMSLCQPIRGEQLQHCGFSPGRRRTGNPSQQLLLLNDEQQHIHLWNDDNGEDQSIVVKLASLKNCTVTCTRADRRTRILHYVAERRFDVRKTDDGNVVERRGNISETRSGNSHAYLVSEH